MMRSVLALCFVANAAAFVATPMLPQRTQVARAAPIAAPQMMVEPSAVDAATTLTALVLPIPAYSPAKVGPVRVQALCRE
eukprot:5942309-Prymnesium_polylepis.1